MSRVLPILFNTEMVQAIMDGRKTVTRRCIKYKYSNTEMKMKTDKYGTRLIEIQKDVEGETYGKNPDGSTWHKLLPYIEKNPPCKKRDILYVRETWCWCPCWDCGMDTEEGCYDKTAVKFYHQKHHEYGCYGYRASFKENEEAFEGWRPSIHMPKEAARIFLKVKDVRVERLQDITDEGAYREGAGDKDVIYQTGARVLEFAKIWDSTIKKSDMEKYGWNANPWVWVIKFERCEKPEEWK